ncbi:MAG: hypothetical protein JSS50_03905 [Proteobacteria bacterium]|nr:hypothetical protein [Pseudomonadota bacterium]
MKDSLIALKDQLLQNQHLKSIAAVAWGAALASDDSGRMTLEMLNVFFRECIKSLESIQGDGGNRAREEFKRALAGATLLEELREVIGLVKNQSNVSMYANFLMVLAPARYFVEHASFEEKQAKEDINRMKLWIASPKAVVEELLPQKAICRDQSERQVLFTEYLVLYAPLTLYEILEQEEYKKHITPEIKAKAGLDSALSLLWARAIEDGMLKVSEGGEDWIAFLNKHGAQPSAQHKADVLHNLFARVAKGEVAIDKLSLRLNRAAQNGGDLNQTILIKEGDKTASLNILQFALHLAIMHASDLVKMPTGGLAGPTTSVLYPKRWEAVEQLINVLKEQKVLEVQTATLNSSAFKGLLDPELKGINVLAELIGRDKPDLALKLINAGLEMTLPAKKNWTSHPLCLLADKIGALFERGTKDKTEEELTTQMEPYKALWGQLFAKIENIDAATIAQILDRFRWDKYTNSDLFAQFATPLIHGLLEKEHVRIVQELGAPDADQATIQSCFSATVHPDIKINIFQSISEDSKKAPLSRIINQWVESKKETAPLSYAFYKDAINKACAIKNQNNKQAVNTPNGTVIRKTFGIITGVGMLSIGLGVAATLSTGMNMSLGAGVMLSDVLLLSGTAITLIGIIGLLADISKGDLKSKAIEGTLAILTGPLIIGVSVHVPTLIANQMNTVIGMEFAMPIGIVVGAIAGLYLGIRYRRSTDSLLPVTIGMGVGSTAGALISKVLPQASSVIASEPIAHTTIILAASLVSALVFLSAVVANETSFRGAT